jgi:small subunit ribosomal protein S1
MRTPVGDEELLVSLEKGQREKDWERAAELLEDEEMLELKVIGKNKGGLLVEFGRLRGFVPNSHLPALATIYDRREQMNQKSKMIDSELPVKVLEIDRKRKRLVLSAKQAQKDLEAVRLTELEEGQVISGRVVNLVPYGAFVDLEGVTGLLHVSELAWHKVDDPADVLDLGQEIEVMVKNVEPDEGRVALSRKELLPNPWEQFAQRYEVGDLLTGEVTALVDFGAFVRLPLEVEGLIHISKMGLLSDIKPEELLSPGDQVIVRLLRIEPDRERIGLSLHEGPIAEENIWPYSQQEEEQPLLDIET